MEDKKKRKVASRNKLTFFCSLLALHSFMFGFLVATFFFCFFSAPPHPTIASVLSFLYFL